MSALRQNNIVRLNQNANFSTTPQRGDRRLGFLKRGRTNNVAAVVRLQAPLPAGSLAPPPSDAVQSGQWKAYPHGRPIEPSIRWSPTSELGTHDSTRSELDALQPCTELHASSAFYQLHGEQGSVHSQSPISPLSQISNVSGSQDSTSSASANYGGTIRIELDASSQEVHQLDGESVRRKPASPSTTTYTPRGMNASWSQYAYSSTQRPHNDMTSASFAVPLPPLAAKAMIAEESTAGTTLDGHAGFDCPIRAGPNGTNLCTWPPRRDISGFPGLARVREHVGSHGLLCPSCHKIFSKPTKYRDHMEIKAQTGMCSGVGEDKSRFSKHLTLSPDTILAFFKKPSRELSDQDAWLLGYKILHREWEHGGSLPSPFYKDNVKNKHLPLARSMLRKDHSFNIQSSNSSVSQIAASFSTCQSTHQEISPLTQDGADPASDLIEQQPASNTSNDLEFTGMLDDWTWTNDPSAEHHFTNNVLEDMTFPMSGALPGSSQSLNIFHPTELDFSIPSEQSNTAGATMVAGDQRFIANANGLDFSKQLSLRTSMLSNEPTGDPYWQSAYRGADHIDSAMELCDTPNSPVTRAEKLMSHPTQSLMPRGINKQPYRPVRTNTPAQQNAVKRIDRLTAKVKELSVKVKGLRLDNRSLQTKIEELESEQEALLDILDQIRMEVDMWDPDDSESPELDERMVLLNNSMQNIKLLLPPK